MSLKEPITSCVPVSLQSVMPPSNTLQYSDISVSKFNHHEGTTCIGEYKFSNSKYPEPIHVTDELVLPTPHPKYMFAHANSSNNSVYCGDGSASSNNTFLNSTQKRYANISREMEMHKSQFLDSAPELQYYNLNESNSPHLSRRPPEHKSVLNYGQCREGTFTTTQNSYQSTTTTTTTTMERRENLTPSYNHPSNMPCTTRRDIHNIRDFHMPNHDRTSSTIIESEIRNNRPFAPQMETNLKSEMLTTKENNNLHILGGKTEYTPLDLDIAKNDTHSHLHSLPIRCGSQVNTNSRYPYSFIHPQQMQKHHPEAGGSFAASTSSQHSRNNPSSPPSSTSSNMNAHSSHSSDHNIQHHHHHYTPSSQNPYNSGVVSQQQYQQHCHDLNNNDYPQQRNAYRYNNHPSSLSGSSITREESLTQNSASSLLLSQQQSCIPSPISVADRVSTTNCTTVQHNSSTNNERILPTPSQPTLHCSSIPHSSSSSSLLQHSSKKQKASITASTNFTNGSSVNQSTTPNSLSNNTTKPQTTNIKFHLLDDPNLKQDEHRSNFVRIDEDQIRKVFHLTQRQAAAFLGVSLSTLKRRFYEMRESLGMDKWPTTGNGTTTIGSTPSNTTTTNACNIPSNNLTPSNPYVNNNTNNTTAPRQSSLNNKGAPRKNSCTSADQKLSLSTTIQANTMVDNQPLYQYENPSRRQSLTSQDEPTHHQTVSAPNTPFSNQITYPSYNTIPQLTNTLPYVDMSLPHPQEHRPANNDSLENFLSRYTPNFLDDISKGGPNQSCLPNPFKRRTNVYGHGHDPVLIATVFSEEEGSVNTRKRSYPNVTPSEIKELERENNTTAHLTRNSSFSSEGSIDSSFEPPRKALKQSPVHSKRGSTDENAEPKSNMSFILNEGVKDPTHLDKEEWNTLMEAFKKQ